MDQSVSRSGRLTVELVDSPKPDSPNVRSVDEREFDSASSTKHASPLPGNMSDVPELDLPLKHKQAYRFTSGDESSPIIPHSSISTSSSTNLLPGHDISTSPQISYKPRHTPPRPSSDSRRQQPHLGAIARLAIDGGLSADQLMSIGSTGQPTALSSDFVNPPIPALPRDRHIIVYPSRKGRDASHHVTSTLTHCIRRPVYQPATHCTTYQPIHLTNRVAPEDEKPFTDEQQHWLRRSPRGHVTLTRLFHSTPRRGSFPMHMTRVGGLVLKPPPVTTTSICDQLFNELPIYQSVSACTSPSSGKHVASSAITFFYSSPTTHSSPTTTSPVSHISTPNTDIVRLGPGNTVIHAVSGESAYDATALIRMHDCPKPYVGCTHASSDVPVDEVDHGLLSDNLSVTLVSRPEQPNTSDPYVARIATNQAQLTSDVPCSGTEDSLIPMTLYQDPGLSSKPCLRASGFSPAVSQIARTVRHLRRIRHIFGDSLGYTSSATSASTSALIGCEKNSSLRNSLIELRTQEPRLMDSVRPASYTCKCTPWLDVHDHPMSPLHSEVSLVPQGLTRFAQSVEESSPSWGAWNVYRFNLIDNALVMTLVPPEEPRPNEDTCINPLIHLHVTLSSDTISWHCPGEFADWDSDIPSEYKFDRRQSYVLATFQNVSLPVPHTRCQVLLERKTASHLFLGSDFAPVDWNAVISPAVLPPKSSQSTESHREPRDKFASGRSCSLGVAGPPGGLPLFRAASTAAASIGMSMVGRTNISSLLHARGQKNVEISSPILIGPVNGVVKNSKDFSPEPSSKTISTDTTTKTSAQQHPSTKQPRPTRDRINQALSRMRRAATASTEATVRSITEASWATRRFASTHGILMHSKSTTVTAKSGNCNVSLAADPSESHIFIEPDVVSSPCVSARLEQMQPNSPALLIAASVSPTPALQTPCLTQFMSSSTEDKSSSAITLDRSSGPLGDIALSSDIPVNLLAEYPSESQNADASLEPSHIPVTSTHVSSATSFVPLPLALSGPLPLHKCPRSTVSPFVPFIIELCVTLVERFGLNCVGLYRLSGSKVAHDFISTELRKPIPDIDVTSDKWSDIHAVCGVLKTFLRNLPDSLFPKVMYADFLAACRLPQREKRLLSFQRLLSIMECYPHHPEYRAHRATLRYLATHLARVSARETVNKMTAYNLALVFAPNLVQPYEDSPELLMSDSKYKIMLVETVIKYHAWIFSPDLGLESGCSIPVDSMEDLSSAVSANPVDMEGTTRSLGESKVNLVTTNSVDSEESSAQSDWLEGDIQLLVAELFHAAADLPPPPSDTDLETAEEPGPSSDRPSDIAMPNFQRPRFTSIPTGAWSSAALRTHSDSPGPSENLKFLPELILTQETDFDMPPDRVDNFSLEGESIVALSRPRPLPVQLGTKLDSLRHLSQGCLDQYTNEARQLGERVAESRRQLENTVAQRLHAEQLLQEARSAQTDTSSALPRTAHSGSDAQYCSIPSQSTTEVSSLTETEGPPIDSP